MIYEFYDFMVWLPYSTEKKNGMKLHVNGTRNDFILKGFSKTNLMLELTKND